MGSPQVSTQDVRNDIENGSVKRYWQVHENYDNKHTPFVLHTVYTTTYQKGGQVFSLNL